MSKYSPFLTTIRTDSYLGPGSNAMPSLLLSAPPVAQTYPGALFFRRVGSGNGLNAIFDAQDKPILKRFKVSCNFADGVLPIESATVSQKFVCSLLLRYSRASENVGALPFDFTEGEQFYFDSFNEWNDVEQFSKWYGVDQYVSNGKFSSGIESFQFRNDAIQTSFAGQLVTFSASFEIEHTFPVVFL